MTPEYRVRRATLDDVNSLIELWKSMHFPAEDLARRVTEFQVAEAPDRKVVGAVGLRMAQRQGLIHSEAYTDFSLAETLRPSLWERLQSVAANHGLHRLWTQEQAPFWHHCGMAKAEEEILAKLPAEWRNSTTSTPWLTLKLKDDLEEVISADKEFALFMEAERQRSQRVLRQARVLKFIAMLIAFGLFFLVVAGAFLLLKRNPHLLHH